MTSPSATPPTHGMDAARLGRIDDFVRREYLDTGRYPGYSLLVSRRGEVAHRYLDGYDDDTVFRIYSMSKPITSVALLQLYEQGRFQLDDPVHRFIPSWEHLEVFHDGTAANYHTRPVERPMQVRDLLTHTSGLTYGWMYRHPVDGIYRKRGITGAGPGTLADMVATLADVPLKFSPGTEWHYSVATDVCGHLVELISGQSLDDYLDEHVFQPLGMCDTAFWVDDDRADRFVPCYAVPSLATFGVPPGAAGDELLRVDGTTPDDSTYRAPKTFFGGGGGLVSTVDDYLRFCTALLRGGELDGERILGPRTVAYATGNHLPGGVDMAAMGQPTFSESNYEGVGFGLGFSVVLDPAQAAVIGSPGAYAWGGAASTLFWIDPVEELIVIGMTQVLPSSAYPIRNELKPMVYGAITG